MTKQEQIDLMIECMFDYARTQVDIKTAIEDSRFINEYKDTLRNYANFLYDNNYRKLPENAVVLTKEEYERLKNDRKIRVVTKHEEDDYEVCIPANEYDEMFEQERKETAKEIYDLCCGHGTTFIKKYLKEKYGVGVEE